MLQRLRARDQDFFRPLAVMADHVAGTATALHNYLNDPVMPPSAATHERRLELDALSEELDRRLIESFIAPIDPNDFTRLNASLHTLGDAIDDAVRLFAVLGLERRREETVLLASFLVSSTLQLQNAVEHLDDARVLAGANTRIMESMREVERIHGSATESLLEGGDVVEILKWKDVLDRLESLVSGVGRAGKLLQRIAVKSQT